MNSPKRNITIKVVVSYMILLLLVILVGSYLYKQIDAFTSLQQHETNDNSKVVRIGRILAIMYENESFGRAAIQSEEAEILTKYIIKNDSLALEIDSLKILTNSPYQVVLVDSIKLLLEEKLQNIFELKSIMEASESDSILDEGIKNFINIESSMGKLTLEDFSSNPENLAKKTKRNT